MEITVCLNNFGNNYNKALFLLTQIEILSSIELLPTVIEQSALIHMHTLVTKHLAMVVCDEFLQLEIWT